MVRQFDREMQAVLSQLERGERPGLLLHVCCAPCSSAVLERLHQAFSVRVFFDNPNMDSREEFDRRLEETRRLVAETGWAREVIHAPYTPEVYQETVKGLNRNRRGPALPGLLCPEVGSGGQGGQKTGLPLLHHHPDLKPPQGRGPAQRAGGARRLPRRGSPRPATSRSGAAIPGPLS